MQSKLAQLRQWVDPLTPLYVLVDPLGGEPTSGINPSPSNPTLQREQGWEREIILISLARQISLPAHQHPYLIELRGPDDPLLELTMGIAEDERLAAQLGGFDGGGRATHAIAGWLQSSMRHAELVKALSDMCRVNTDAFTRAKYLRLGDRRVLDLLCHVAGDERVALQLGRIQSWTYLTPTGDLRRLQSPHEEGMALCLSEAEWQRMARGDRIHRTMSTFLGECAAAGKQSCCISYTVVEAAIFQAEEAIGRWPHRFRSTHDEIIWAAMSLRCPGFHQLSTVQELMAEDGDEEGPPEPVRYLYGDLLALVEREQTTMSPI